MITVESANLTGTAATRDAIMQCWYQVAGIPSQVVSGTAEVYIMFGHYCIQQCVTGSSLSGPSLVRGRRGNVSRQNTIKLPLVTFILHKYLRCLSGQSVTYFAVDKLCLN